MKMCIFVENLRYCGIINSPLLWKPLFNWSFACVYSPKCQLLTTVPLHCPTLQCYGVH